MTFHQQKPLMIGGVGGSGTRVVADIALRSGFYMGSDLNDANDNHWFTLLLKRSGLLSPGAEMERTAAMRVFAKLMTTNDRLTFSERGVLRRAAREPRPQHERRWLIKHARAAKKRPAVDASQFKGWGWKEPNTHMFLEPLNAEMPDCRYVHVIRHGLDMAFSDNQNQYRLWQRHFGLDVSDEKEISPAEILTFWRRANEKVIESGRMLGERFFLLIFEYLCFNPELTIPRLLDFMGVPEDEVDMSALTRLPSPPASIGRYRQEDRNQFRTEDVEYVRSLGFKI